MFKSYVDDEEINMFAFIYKHDTICIITVSYTHIKSKDLKIPKE